MFFCYSYQLLIFCCHSNLLLDDLIKPSLCQVCLCLRSLSSSHSAVSCGSLVICLINLTWCPEYKYLPSSLSLCWWFGQWSVSVFVVLCVRLWKHALVKSKLRLCLLDFLLLIWTSPGAFFGCFLDLLYETLFNSWWSVHFLLFCFCFMLLLFFSNVACTVHRTLDTNSTNTGRNDGLDFRSLWLWVDCLSLCVC